MWQKNNGSVCGGGAYQWRRSAAAAKYGVSAKQCASAYIISGNVAISASASINMC